MARPVAPRDLLRATLLLLAGIGLALLIVRSAATALLLQSGSSRFPIGNSQPEPILAAAMREMTTNRGRVSPQTMEQVAEAARAAPLDARPFFLFALQDLVRGENARALATLEAGRRLDGRQRWIRLLLLDRYLRANRFADAAGELGVLSRIVSAAQSPIVDQLARMSQDPATRQPVRQMLANDPVLERAMLATLARAAADPELLFSIASPTGLAGAGAPGGWGEALIASMVTQRRFHEARTVWRRVYAVPPAAAAALLYDADLRGAPGGPPFNWTFAQGGVGAADRSAGRIAVEYYGRDSGALAGQLLTLRPGRYRFAFVQEGAGMASPTSTLAWNVACAGTDPATTLANAPLSTAGNGRRRQAIVFTVPSTGCPAQQLSLMGISAEYPTTVDTTLGSLTLQREDSSQ